MPRARFEFGKREIQHVAPASFGDQRKAESMLWTLAVVLLILWLLGMISSYTLGGFIHILLVVAIVMVLVRIIQGERPL
jgi:fatty acid desaturase